MPMIIEQNEPALEPIAIVGMDSPSKFWETLREKKTLRTPRVPKERFNIDAHYHPDLGRPGSFSAMGGYFLAEDPVDFDPSFFHMTPIEAQWLDPQQRKMLEVCYEVLENAGVPLERAAGSNTGVYVASFTSDYQQMSIFERDFRHNYAATGVDPGIISNRINNAFNLNGPSCIINTACSSSVYGIHNACHALRTRDCDAAIAAGSNLVMIVDQHMNTAKLGVLSPTSECHTFDERADGYGRAEGIGALYLKRLSDAIKDKDVIRGVIRSSAVNTNGKVEGMGITFPNALGQEKVLRHAYERANLDPNQTAYLECHGTGTPTGDPIECRAVSLGMNDSRSADKPLLLGAAKANIGHSEAASGIFAAMKAALMTEKGEIPGVYGFQTLNPNIKDKEWNIEIVRELQQWPAGFTTRRASVSSFGYGGTNAHLVIEAADNLCPWYSHGQPKAIAGYNYDDAAPRPLLVAMSAHDAPTLRRNIAAHQAVAADYHLADLAYTLNCRRTRFAGARGYAIVAPGHETEAISPDGFAYGAALSRPATVGFVFTGQGAQWARMGAEALTTFPRFAETMGALDRVLQHIEPRPAWSLCEVLEAPAASSRVGEPEIAQPVCTAVQIAIVDLFASWGIEPTVTVGHSSGEIAAAYAAGRLSAPEAMLAAYFRGYAVARAAPAGAMLAVGLGADQVPEYLAKLPADAAARLTIACENSPSSVTMSGGDADVQALKRVLDDAGVFARALKTGKAYHSSQMDAVAPMYAELYAAAHETLSETQLVWRRPVVGMVSSVTGAVVQATELPITYWCDNLRSRVLFDRALTTLGATPDFTDVNILVEIGPHAALGGPVKQIVAAREYDMQYVASLTRDTDSAVALLRTAGELFNRGFEVAFDQINSFEATSSTGTTVERAKASSRDRNGPRYLPDLPHYQWNYERRHWWQPRVMKELRESKHPRHDVLGRRIFGLSSDAATWKNVLRQRDVAWFADHTLGQDVVFPAAGHVSLAVEALLQLLDLEPADMAGAGVALRDISIQTALIVPETDDGVEVHTRLERLDGPGNWYAFTVESVAAATDDDSGSDGGDKDVWTRHSTGKIRARPRETPDETPACPVPLSQLHQQASGTRWYKSFRRVGFRYGPSMQTLTHVRANGRDRVTAAGVKVQTKCDAMPHESRYLLHPATIDGCLHAVIAAVHRGRHKEMPWGVIPLEIAEMALRFPAPDDVADEGRCTAWADRAWDRYFGGGLQLFGGASGKCLMDIQGWKFITYDAVLPPQMTAPAPREPYRVVRWQDADEAAQASLTAKAGSNSNVAVVHATRDSPLARALGATPIPVSRHSVNELDKVVVIDSDGSGASTPLDDDVNNFERIVIDDADGSLLAGALNEETWEALRNILQSHKPVVWVTRGAHSGRCVDAGLPQGFLRAVRVEAMAPSIALVDADDEAPLEKLAGLVQHELGAMASPTPGVDVECWLTRDARVLVPRLETHDQLNKLLYQAPEAEVATLPVDGAWQGKMVENEVIFESTPMPAALGHDDVELRVAFAEMTKDDLAPRAPARARLVTGTVVRVGSGVDEGLRGRTVAAVTRAPPLVTCVVTSVFAPLPAAGTTPAAAVHALPPLARAVDATRGAGPDDHILLLPGAPRPFERAVAQLGAHIGFCVSRVPKGAVDVTALLQSATDGDDHDGRPPIVVAAGAGGRSSGLVPEVWRVLPRGAQLVLSDVPVDPSLDVRPLARGARLRVGGVAEGLDNDPAALREMLGRAVEMLEKIAPTPGPVLSVEELCDLDRARDAMAETGADVLSIKYGESRVKIRQPHEPVRFSPEAAYLLVGCLGGLGRSLTTWMLERGCRHFVFLSRSGTAKPEAADVVRRLQDAGAEVQVCCVDACDEEAVGGVVAKVAYQRPIKGVVHAAMVLQDGLYETMTLSAYSAALGPKRQAALALDKALGATPLDFFVLTSSISAVLGNAGQANYAAGNSCLDHVALARRRRGLAACALALPLVEDVGVVAENEALAAALARKMPFGVDEREMLRGFEAAIRHGAVASGPEEPTLGDAQLVLGLEPRAMRDALDGRPLDDAFWFHDARMAPVRAELERLAAEAGTSQTPGGGGGGSDFAASLAGLPEDEALEAIGRHIAARAARILGAPADGFALEGASVASHGIDSMIGVELQAWLFKAFGLQLSVQVLSNPKTTFAGLARTAAQQMGILAV